MGSGVLSKKELSFIAGELEMDKTKAVFMELKLIKELKKTKLCGKILKWIGNNEMAAGKFIGYLLNEKAKNKIVKIVE